MTHRVGVTWSHKMAFYLFRKILFLSPLKSYWTIVCWTVSLNSLDFFVNVVGPTSVRRFWWFWWRQKYIGYTAPVGMQTKIYYTPAKLQGRPSKWSRAQTPNISIFFLSAGCPFRRTPLYIYYTHFTLPTWSFLSAFLFFRSNGVFCHVAY